MPARIVHERDDQALGVASLSGHAETVKALLAAETTPLAPAPGRRGVASKTHDR